MTRPAAPAPSPLDDLDRHRALDAGGMHDAIAGLAAQLHESITLAARIDWRTTKPTTPAGICLCGMGGSAIGGDLARACWEHESPIPFAVVRGYMLPAHINDHWFIIATSYSGNTEETLAAAKAAQSRGCRRILAITSGGQLADLARDYGWMRISLPAGLMPRAALGYLFGATMMTLAHWGVAGNNPSDLSRQTEESLRATAALLEGRALRLSRTVPLDQNPAKRIARTIAKRTIVVWGVTGSTDVAAVRVKSQLCENGKALTFANAIPEVSHNEIVGLTQGPSAARDTAVIVLESADDPVPAVRQRNALVHQLQEWRIPVVGMEAAGHTRIQRNLSLVQLGDFVSYYVAILNDVDPTPIPAIEQLKAALAHR